jgi:hypothetical protein
LSGLHFIDPQSVELGGMPVRRLLPARERQMIGPFIFLDHFGPAAFPAGHGVDIRPHPHIGLATVTWLFEGELMHRDSLGYAQVIRPGDVNWMTAGRGIVHSERTPQASRAAGSRIHGMQCWVALPRDAEEIEPAFHHVGARDIPGVSEDGVSWRIIAGRFHDLQSPVEIFSPMTYVSVDLVAGAQMQLPLAPGEWAIYLVSGKASLDGQALPTGQLALLPPGIARAALEATMPARLMLLGGEPLDGPRHIWWNFVSSSPERIRRAADDWRRGQFPVVPGDDEALPVPDR